MTIQYDQSIPDSMVFTSTADPGTSDVGGGTSFGVVPLQGSRPVLLGSIVNPDATHALTVLWQYKSHPDDSWKTIPAAYGDHSTTAAANATTNFKVNTEGMQFMQIRAYFAAGGSGDVIFRGTASDKAPGGVVNVDANLGNVGLVDTSETPIDPATEDKQDDGITVLKLATAVSASVLYDGQANADKRLALAATETAFDALGTTPDEIALTGDVNAIRCFMSSTTQSDSGRLCVGQFDASDNLLEVLEVDVVAQDITFKPSDDTWGLSVGDTFAKNPIVAYFKRNDATSYLKLWMSNYGTGPWYLRYQLEGGVG
jgi:hypothetical protein